MMIVKRKKAKRTKKCVIKRILKFNDYEDCLFNNKMILKVIIILYILNKSIRLH